MGLFDDLLRNMFGGETIKTLAAPVITCVGDVVTMTGTGTIYYTTDGSTPTSSSNVYTSPITIIQDTLFNAYCVNAGMNDSPVTTYFAEWRPNMNRTYFYVEDVSGSENTLIIKSYTDAPRITVYKSTNGTTWTSMGTTSTTQLTATIPANGKLFLKAVANSWANKTNQTYPNNIDCLHNYKVGGNIMSLLYGDNFIGKTTFQADYALSRLFFTGTVDANKIRNIDNLKLPATARLRCYEEMFLGCSGLTSIPNNFLPSGTTANGCYESMFSGCSGLTNVPSNLLPATTIVYYCYSNMFQGCTSLTTAPNLPATSLDEGCYNQMFQGCTSLTTAPVLPAKTITQYYHCYSRMFYGCSSLKNLTCLLTSGMGVNYNTLEWMNGVGSNGTFTKAASATGWSSGSDGIPRTWTVVDA